MAQNRLAEQLGLNFNPQANVYYGETDGFTVLFGQFNGLWSIVVSATDGSLHNETQMNDLCKKSDAITRCTVQGTRFTFIIKSGLTGKALRENYERALEFVMEFLKLNNFKNCCEYRMTVGPTGVYYLAGTVRILSAESYQELSREVSLKNQETKMIHENIPLGIAGAVGGALIGAVIIILFARLGFVSIWSGVAMGYLTMKAYEKFGGKLSVAGMIISAVVMLLATLFANRMDWAIEIARAFNENIFTAFGEVMEVVNYSGLQSEYMRSLLLMVVFTLVGAIIAVISQVRNNKNSQSSFVIKE